MSKRFRPRVPPVLDLNKRHFELTAHGILVIGTWYRHSRTRWEPCLAMTYANRPIHPEITRPIIILLKDAWKWALHGEVGDPAHCVASIIEWLHEGLLPGSPANKRDHMNVMDAVNRRLTDLIAMPPRPKGDEYAIADAVMVNKLTGEIVEKEIKFDA